MIPTGLAKTVRPVFYFTVARFGKSRINLMIKSTMTAIILRAIEKYQPKPEQLGSEQFRHVACLVGILGRLSTGRMWSGFDFGRLSTTTRSTSDNQDHEPRNTPTARFALSPPIGILQMDKP